MNITADSVKQLRERTGAGMMECKKALVETQGDLDAAAELMRKSGLAKADKKAARVAAEGTVAIERSGNDAALVEVNCETDFVARSDEFQAFAKAVAAAALKAAPSSLEDLLKLSHEGSTLDERRRALIAKIGENMAVRRFVRVSSPGPSGHLYSRLQDRQRRGIAGRRRGAGARYRDACRGRESGLHRCRRRAGRVAAEGA